MGKNKGDQLIIPIYINEEIVLDMLAILWVMSAKDDYTECIYENNWNALSDADAFYMLNQFIGNR